MISLYYWGTPNGRKIAIILEELGIDYKIYPIDISKGDQFKHDFLIISPNNKIPAIIDHSPIDEGDPISVFESGAILIYLAEKYAKFISKNSRERKEILEWLSWQVSGLGPMLGQNNHFNKYAKIDIPYAKKRYIDETERLFGVLEKRLDGREYIVDNYSIVDMACYPWVVLHDSLSQDINKFPNIAKWLKKVGSRPAVINAYNIKC